MDVPFLTLGHESVKICQCTILRINVVVVAHIVLVVGLAGMNGHQPKSGDTQILQIIQLGRKTLQVADSIAVRIAERINKHLVIGTVVVVRAFAQRFDLCKCLLG